MIAFAESSIGEEKWLRRVSATDRRHSSPYAAELYRWKTFPFQTDQENEKDAGAVGVLYLCEL